MDFNKISPKTFVGKLLRFPLHFIPANMKMPILRGRLRGKQWIVEAGRHGCWLGTYEYDQQLLVEKTLKPGSIVFDIGAHSGFYTLLASMLVGSTGRVFAFEPLPRNLKYLKKHLALNDIKNVTVLEAAVSEKGGVKSFKNSDSSYQGRISSQGSLQVNTVSLDELISREKIPVPDYIKMDIEGAESKALLGAKSMLAQAHPTIFLSIHGRPIYKQCTQLLEALDYQIETIDWNGVGEFPKNPELLVYYKGK